MTLTVNDSVVRDVGIMLIALGVVLLFGAIGAFVQRSIISWQIGKCWRRESVASNLTTEIDSELQRVLSKTFTTEQWVLVRDTILAFFRKHRL